MRAFMLKILMTAFIAFGYAGNAGAGPKQNGYPDTRTAGYTFYTSHGTVVRGEPVHNWQTYDDACDLPSEGCDENHRIGIGG